MIILTIAVSMILSRTMKSRYLGELSNGESDSARHDVAEPINVMAKEMTETADQSDKSVSLSQEKEDETSPHWTAQELVSHDPGYCGVLERMIFCR